MCYTFTAEIYLWLILAIFFIIHFILDKCVIYDCSSSDIRPRLSSLHKGITHESQDVRMQALNQLRHLLYTNQVSWYIIMW